MKMNAVVLHGPGDFRLEQVDKPVCPVDGLLLKVKYCGLCGSDLRILFNPHKNVKYPAVIGHEITGIVEEVGKNYDEEYVKGDALAVAPTVYCGKCDFCKMAKFEFCESIREIAQHWPGGFAEYTAIPKEALKLGAIMKVPEGMDMAHACIAEPPSSCINAQEKLQVGLGDRVLIIGAGPIGNIHACVARARGAKQVIISDIFDDRLEMSRQFNPDHVINSKTVNLEEEVLRLTEGKGPDVVITANSVATTQVQAINIARKGGRIALFGGLPHGKSTIDMDTNLIHYKALSVIGTTGFAPRHHILSMDLMRSGAIPGDKLISDIMPLSDFAKAVEKAREGKAMKVVFRME